jgi:hypothetical protein
MDMVNLRIAGLEHLTTFSDTSSSSGDLSAPLMHVDDEDFDQIHERATTPSFLPVPTGQAGPNKRNVSFSDAIGVIGGGEKPIHKGNLITRDIIDEDFISDIQSYVHILEQNTKDHTIPGAIIDDNSRAAVMNATDPLIRRLDRAIDYSKELNAEQPIPDVELDEYILKAERLRELIETKFRKNKIYSTVYRHRDIEFIESLSNKKNVQREIVIKGAPTLDNLDVFKKSYRTLRSHIKSLVDDTNTNRLSNGKLNFHAMSEEAGQTVLNIARKIHDDLSDIIKELTAVRWFSSLI